MDNQVVKSFNKDKLLSHGIDIWNYTAILIFEQLGICSPTEEEIKSVEILLKNLKNSSYDWVAK